MILAYVAVVTKPTTSNEFERIVREIQADVRQMAGCIKNEWFRDPDFPRRFVIYGEFDTQENFERYLKSPVVERIGSELIPLLDSPPEFKHYNAAVIDGSG